MPAITNADVAGLPAQVLEALLAVGLDESLSDEERREQLAALLELAKDPEALRESLEYDPAAEPEEEEEAYAPARPVAYVRDDVGHEHDDPQQYASHHAPVGGVTIGGRQFRGGQFIPANVMKAATTEERAAVEGEKSEGKAESAEAPAAGTQGTTKRSRLAGALASLKKKLSREALHAKAEELLAGAKDPASTAKKAYDVALERLKALKDRYGYSGASAIGSAYLAYYVAAGTLAPWLFTLPVPLTGTIMTSAEIVRGGLRLLKGTPAKDEGAMHEPGQTYARAEETEPEIVELAEATREYLAAIAEVHGETLPELNDGLLEEVLAALLEDEVTISQE